jgi:hypothetical protein
MINVARCSHLTPGPHLALACHTCVCECFITLLTFLYLLPHYTYVCVCVCVCVRASTALRLALGFVFHRGDFATASASRTSARWSLAARAPAAPTAPTFSSSRRATISATYSFTSSRATCVFDVMVMPPLLTRIAAEPFVDMTVVCSDTLHPVGVFYTPKYSFEHHFLP